MKSILSKLTYHAVYEESILAALTYAKKLGFAGIQLAVETPHFSFEALSAKELAEIASFREQNDLLMSIHAPDSLTSMFTSSPTLLTGIFDYLEKLLNFAQTVGAHIVTLHPGAPVVYRTDEKTPRTYPKVDEQLYKVLLRENLKRLANLNEGKTTICFESYQTSQILYGELEEHLQVGNFSLCWDVAKTWGKSEVEDYLWQHLDMVKQVHLHDLHKGRSHLIVGQGEIDFRPYLKGFQDSNIAEICIEVRPREAALESRQNLIALLKE